MVIIMRDHCLDSPDNYNQSYVNKATIPHYGNHIGFNGNYNVDPLLGFIHQKRLKYITNEYNNLYISYTRHTYETIYCLLHRL